MNKLAVLERWSTSSFQLDNGHVYDKREHPRRQKLSRLGCLTKLTIMTWQAQTRMNSGSFAEQRG
jgi:hypothetical protein